MKFLGYLALFAGVMLAGVGLDGCKKKDPDPIDPNTTPQYKVTFTILNDTLPIEGALIGLANMDSDCQAGIFRFSTTTSEFGKGKFSFFEPEVFCYKVSANVGGIVQTASGHIEWTTSKWLEEEIKF